MNSDPYMAPRKWLYYRAGLGRPQHMNEQELTDMANVLAAYNDQARLRLAWHIGAALGICNDVTHRWVH